MSGRRRVTDPQALDALYNLPASAPPALPDGRWWERASALCWAWAWRPLEATQREPEDQRRQRLEHIALGHARALTTDSMVRKTARLTPAEIVEVLGHVARLTDVQPWVRVTPLPDGRARSLEDGR